MANYKYDECVEWLDERLDRFTKLLECHKEIEWQNEHHLKEWKERRKTA